MIEADELIESDREIRDKLQNGRWTPAVLVEWTGLSKQPIHNRLNVLVAAGHVENAHESRLYELVADSRDDWATVL
jgi:DNA-binding IclR family transcriptional regulator